MKVRSACLDVYRGPELFGADADDALLPLFVVAGNK